MRTARIAFGANWLLMSGRHRSTPFGRYAGTTRRAPAGASPSQPRYMTTVVRLPSEIAEELAAAGSALLGPGSPHYRYPPPTIHLTVLGLADLARLENEVREVVGRHLPFGVEVGGLNLSRETVFAELYPVGFGLMELREGLRHLESHEHGAISRWVRRRIAHANLIRFTAPVDARVVAEVGRMRRKSFGRFRVEEVELVRTDKVMSAEGTRTVARCPLR